MPLTVAQELFTKNIQIVFKELDLVEHAYKNDEAKKAQWYEDFINVFGPEKASQILNAYERRKRSQSK